MLGRISFFLKETGDTKFAKKLLKIYFKGNLTEAEVNLLADSQMQVHDLWIEAIRGKNLTDIELELLVRRIPWYFTWRFPVSLSEAYLKVLFAERNPVKIVAYCRDFSLPKEFETELLEKYQQSLSIADSKMQYSKFGRRQINGWAEAIEEYLRSSDYNNERFVSQNVQQQLLNMKNADLTRALIKRCTIVKNTLHEDIIWSLVEQQDEKLIAQLLCESYLPNIPALLVKLEENMPQLKTQMEIAQYRREVYLIEQEQYVFLGALAFLPREEKIIRKYAETSDEDKDEFIDLYIKPWMGSFRPCMCAYMAYHFPDLASQLLDVVEKFATDCKQHGKIY